MTQLFLRQLPVPLLVHFSLPSLDLTREIFYSCNSGQGYPVSNHGYLEHFMWCCSWALREVNSEMQKSMQKRPGGVPPGACRNALPSGACRNPLSSGTCNSALGECPLKPLCPPMFQHGPVVECKLSLSVTAPLCSGGQFLESGHSNLGPFALL